MASFIPVSYSGPGVSATTNDVIPYGPVLQWQLVGNPGSHGGTGATGSFNAPGLTGATGGITGLFFVENLCGDPSNSSAIIQRATDTSTLQQWVRRPTSVGVTPVWSDWVLNGPGSGGGGGGSQTIFLQNGAIGGLSNGSWLGQCATYGTEINMSLLMPSAGTASNLFGNIDVSPGAGQSRNWIIRLNGVNTSLNITFGPDDLTASDIVDTVAYAAGDLLSLQTNDVSGSSHVADGIASFIISPS